MHRSALYALTRAARIVGVRPERIRQLPTDTHFRLDLDALREAVREDRAEGLEPIAVCANAGATNTGAVDPLPEIADQVVASVGPSGTNVEYVLKLAQTLRAIGAEDHHVFRLEALVRDRL